jgi:hypothetical protein
MTGTNNAVNNTLGAISATSINFGGSTLSTYTASTSFTPNLAFGGASTGIMYSTQNGVYARIGSCVYVWITLILTSKGSATGTAAILNLPFANASNTGILGSVLVSNVTYTGQVVANLGSGATGAGLFNQITSPGSITQLMDTAFANSSIIYLSGFYFA